MSERIPRSRAGARAEARARGPAPTLLRDALPRVVESLGLEAGLEDARLLAEWERAVGPEIASVARPHRLDGDTLIVHVKHSAWMAELSLRRREILTRVNGGRSRRKLTRLILRIEAQEAHPTGA